MIDQDALVRNSYALEPLSPTVVKLAALVADENADISEIVNVASTDPALGGELMRVANSARFGSGHDIGTINDAVIRIGTATTLETATRASVRSTVDRPLTEFGYTDGVLWRHCCAASTAAELARRKHCKVRVSPEASTASLLHDIGKLAIAQFLPPKVQRLLDSALRSGVNKLEAEREILGVDHAEVGGLILQHWRLPDSIRIAVTCHHDPDRAECVMADLVHVAATAATRHLPPGSGEAVVPQLSALARLGMDETAFEELCTELAVELDKDADLAEAEPA